jgi:hypothetical protein
MRDFSNSDLYHRARTKRESILRGVPKFVKQGSLCAAIPHVIKLLNEAGDTAAQAITTWKGDLKIHQRIRDH